MVSYCRKRSKALVQGIGARAGNRTLNLGIKSPLLCQLSYASTVEMRAESRF